MTKPVKKWLLGAQKWLKWLLDMGRAVKDVLDRLK